MGIAISRGDTHTWPPGPELRAKLKSTMFRGTVATLNAFSHSRALAVSALVSRFNRAGGMGSDNLGAFAWNARRRRAAEAHDRLRTSWQEGRNIEFVSGAWNRLQ